MALDVLEVERNERDGAEEREADDERDRAADAEDTVPEELERQDRLGRMNFGEDERNQQDDAGGDEGFFVSWNLQSTLPVFASSAYASPPFSWPEVDR